MYDHRSAHGPGTQVQRASEAGSPGKTTLTAQLNGGPEPVATAASHHKRKSLLQALHEVLHKAADKIKEKISDKVKEAPEKLLEKLLAKLEKAADHAIDHGLEEGAKNCLSQAEVDHVVAAINTTRLIASFHLLDDLDKATLAEIHSLHSDESIIQKAKDLFQNVGDALDALNKFSDAMDTANGHINQLLKLHARCLTRPIPQINPQLKPFIVPKPKELPDKIPLPPDVVHHKPSFHIHIDPLNGIHVGT